MEKKPVDVSYIPVDMFVRISRREGEIHERALLVARRKDNGKEFTFLYQDLNEDDRDLIVNDYETE